MLRLGLLSTARINCKLVAGARDVDGVEVVVTGSRDLARAERHARELGIPRAAGSYDAVLEDPEVDAVYIALPNAGHVPWTIRALEAGKHVLCEKPMSRRPDDVHAAFDAADRAALVLAEAFMWRHHPATARLLELLPEVGTLRVVRAAFSFAIADASDVRLSGELDGGALMDVGCYCLSGARLVAGEPFEVSALQVDGGRGVDVRLAATLRFAGDVLAHFDCGFDMVDSDTLEVVGDGGSLLLGDPWHGRRSALGLRRADGSLETVGVEAADPYGCELRDFAAAVARERPAAFGRADALGQARAIAALYESAANGRTVAL
jgi:xylose dehydrogenase (NAD/NADP)